MKNNENNIVFESPAMNFPKSITYNSYNYILKTDELKNNFSPGGNIDFSLCNKQTPRNFISEFNICNEIENKNKKDIGIQVGDELLNTYIENLNNSIEEKKKFETPKTESTINNFSFNEFLNSSNSIKKNLINEFDKEPKNIENTCNCSKSGCLKLYCKCFRNGIICNIQCKCIGCYNNESNEVLINLHLQEAIYKNPLAFEKIIDNKVKITKGCKCKKSKCDKKYCECFASNNTCGPMCQCIECYNNKKIESEEKIESYKNIIKKIKKDKKNQKYNLSKKSEIINRLKESIN